MDPLAEPVMPDTKSPLRLLPNAITIIRLLLVLPIAFFIMEENFYIALLLFSISGMSDGLDGFLARRFDWVSAFGKLIDPLADKLMMMVTVLVLGLLGHFPFMLMLLIIAKDLVVLAGVFSYTTLAGFPAITPTFFGKLTTALQIMLLFSLLLNLSFPALSPAIGLLDSFFPVFYWVVAILTTLDGTSYLWIWTGKLARDPRWKETI